MVTFDEFVKLGACSDNRRFALPGSFPVSDLVADDLSILAAGGRGLPPKHDALRGKLFERLKEARCQI